MRSLLSVSLPAELTQALQQASKTTHLTRSELVKLALRDYLRRYELGELRARLVPKARAKGLFTDEDIFRSIDT